MNEAFKRKRINERQISLLIIDNEICLTRITIKNKPKRTRNAPVSTCDSIIAEIERIPKT